MTSLEQRRIPGCRDGSDGFPPIDILAAMAIPAMEQARQSPSSANMHGLGSDLQINQNDHKFYPDGSLSIGQVVAALQPVSRAPLPSRDAWYHDFSCGTGRLNACMVECFGRDGGPGADITPSRANNVDLDIVLSNGQFVAAVN